MDDWDTIQKVCSYLRLQARPAHSVCQTSRLRRAHEQLPAARHRVHLCTRRKVPEEKLWDAGPLGREEVRFWIQVFPRTRVTGQHYTSNEAVIFLLGQRRNFRSAEVGQCRFSSGAASRHARCIHSPDRKNRARPEIVSALDDARPGSHTGSVAPTTSPFNASDSGKRFAPLSEPITPSHQSYGFRLASRALARAKGSRSYPLWVPGGKPQKPKARSYRFRRPAALIRTHRGLPFAPNQVHTPNALATPPPPSPP